jgi:hypothetical protein
MRLKSTSSVPRHRDGTRLFEKWTLGCSLRRENLLKIFIFAILALSFAQSFKTQASCLNEGYRHRRLGLGYALDVGDSQLGKEQSILACQKSVTSRKQKERNDCFQHCINKDCREVTSLFARDCAYQGWAFVDNERYHKSSTEIEIECSCIWP